VISPAELAAGARAPEAGPILAPVERRVIENTVTARADVTYADAVDVTVDPSGFPGPAVVTGRVPEVGAAVDAGGVALEVAGRPLIALPGALPAYRTLRAGLSGPDVLQLKAALTALGIDPGNATSPDYDAATAAGVAELYRRAGYTAPSAGPDSDASLRAARSAERGAEAGLAEARAALARASTGPRADARVEADNAVREAQRALEAAVASGAVSDSDAERLRDDLELALARRDTVLAPPDVSAEAAAVAAAEQQLADAQNARQEAETNALTPLPSGEVVFLPTLPRRVDSVGAVRGDVVKGPVMSVSGADLRLEGTLVENDAQLVKAGMAARFSLPDGTAFPATVGGVAAKRSDAGTAGDTDGVAATGKDYDITLDPGDLPADVVERIRGSNVKVEVPVQATDGAVLAVPVAALSAGPSGESRVELEVQEDSSSRTDLVAVTTGLAAGGFVEVRSDDERLTAGARVVVGR
jgi:peptidoglycan hydrolase-like protein with peptidoglycan-binding domain